MHRVIAIEFMTLDGVMEDPDGAAGTPGGGWAFRYGPAAVAGDKFRLGELLDTGALVLGRQTWQHFSALWPSRTDGFSARMNAIPKLVVSRTLTQTDAWPNSTRLEGDLVEEVAGRKCGQDLVVVGSASVLHTLMQHDLIDEYRLLTFPIVLGHGRRVFDGHRLNLELTSLDQVGPAVLAVYRRSS